MRAIPFRCNLTAFYVLAPATGEKRIARNVACPTPVKTWKRERATVSLFLFHGVLRFPAVFDRTVNDAAILRLPEYHGNLVCNVTGKNNGDRRYTGCVRCLLAAFLSPVTNF